LSPCGKTKKATFFQRKQLWNFYSYECHLRLESGPRYSDIEHEQKAMQHIYMLALLNDQRHHEHTSTGFYTLL
jgi:hypothetical protein